MTIKTLTYIHELLKEALYKQENALKIARENYNAMFDKEEAGEKTNINTYKELSELCSNSYWEAKSALEDFENKEW